MKFKLLAIIHIAITGRLFAQNSDNYNMWYQYLMSAKISEKSNLHALTQYRSFDMAYDARLFLVSSYVDYEITDRISPAAGFMVLLLKSYPDGENKKERIEKRPFQQVTMSDNIGRTSISHRFRIEERFISNPNDFIVRLRYLLSFRIPLNKMDKKESIYAIVKDEIRMAIVKDEPFDSNRLTMGFGYKVNSKSAVEVAFINQLETRETNNYIYVGYRNSFDWRKKKKTQNN